MYTIGDYASSLDYYEKKTHLNQICKCLSYNIEHLKPRAGYLHGLFMTLKIAMENKFTGFLQS